MRLLKDSRFRVLIYMALFLSFYIFSLFADTPLYLCPINEFLGIDCPGCGTTRSFLSILKLEFNTALHLNPLFVLFIFPASVLSFIQDILCAVLFLFTGKKRFSFVDFILFSIFGD